MNEPCDGERARADQETGDQHQASVDAVDQKSGRRLHHRRHDVEGGESEPQLGIADAVILAHEHEQRRQQHDVVVADEVRKAHAADKLVLGGARRRQRQLDSLTHRVAAALDAPAARIASQTRAGVAGMWIWRMPYSDSASTSAFMIETSAPAQPASPQPLTPSGLVVAGTGWSATENIGASLARGSA